MKNNPKITSMSRLRKEKRRLELQISQEKTEIISEVEKYKNSLWPFRVMNNIRKTIDSISENKLVVLGAQLAYSALNAKKESKEKKEDGADADSKSSVIDFLKKTATNFLENYIHPQDSKKEEKE